MNRVATLHRRVDAALGRLPMYRVVSICLLAMVTWSYFLAVTKSLPPSVFGLGPMTVTLITLLAASVLSNLACGHLAGVRPHTESAVITGLLLWFLYWPQSNATTLTWLAVTAVLANASKYVLAVRGRHLFNPAAAGVVLVVLIQEALSVLTAHRVFTTWWIANEPSLVVLAAAALLVLVRTRRVELGATFVTLSGVLTILGSVNAGVAPLTALSQFIVSSPALFLAGFMLSEPLTLPPRRGQRLIAATVAAIVFAWPTFQTVFLATPGSLWVFDSTAELALIASGLVGFACGQRGGVRLKLRSKRKVAGDVWEFSFVPKRPIRFRPGQHLELAVPHPGTDRRGDRRTFSIASPDTHPEGVICVALRVPEPGTSFKRALMELELGSTLTATTVGGDFLVRGQRPLLLVAGGIGITPFLSLLLSESASGLQGRDVILVYAVTDASNVAFREEVTSCGVPVVLISPTPPDALPPRWTHVPGEFVTAEALAIAVPDLAQRDTYVSGPPVMVSALRSTLRGRTGRVRTDSFAGY